MSTISVYSSVLKFKTSIFLNEFLIDVYLRIIEATTNLWYKNMETQEQQESTETKVERKRRMWGEASKKSYFVYANKGRAKRL